MTSSMSFPIDAVIPWVDGSDPQHAAKLSAYLATLGKSRPKAANPTRFHNAGELDYCVTSLLRFAPWIRTIFIVTDEQRPALMEELRGSVYEDKVKLVDHKTIFAGYEAFLPSFNSMAITSLIWRIPGLAENFIYFNDDFALIRPVPPELFFDESGVVLRGRWVSQRAWVKAVLKGLKLRRYHPERISYWALQQACANVFDFRKKYFRLPHVPHPWRKSTWEMLSRNYQTNVEKNIRGQLRQADQYVPESLSAHYEIRNGSARLDSRPINLQLKPAEQSLFRVKLKLGYADVNPRVVFACVQSIETASQKKQELIFKWLDKRIGSLRELCQSDVAQEPLPSRYTGEADTTGCSSDLPR